MEFCTTNIVAYAFTAAVATYIGWRLLPNARVTGKDAKYFVRAPRFKFVYAVLNEIAYFTRHVFGRNLFSFSTAYASFSLSCCYACMHAYDLYPSPHRKLIEEAKTDKFFGPQDQLYRGLEAFMDGASRFPLNFIGQLTLNGYPAKCLTARRQVVNYINANPHIADIPIKGPLIILGLPRTGSTLIYNLLAQDPATRAPYMFEMFQFIDPTPPTTKETFDTDPRIKQTEDRLEFFNSVADGVVDEMSRSHPAKPFSPDEELIILFHQLIAQPFFVVAGEKYLDWVLDEGKKDYVYIYLKRFLQMMSSSWAPTSHWTLKSPFHAIMIGELLGQFPDARIVITHRKLENVLPSFAKLMEAQTYAWAEDASVDRRMIGRLTMRASKLMVDRLDSFRKVHWLFVGRRTC